MLNRRKEFLKLTAGAIVIGIISIGAFLYIKDMAERAR